MDWILLLLCTWLKKRIPKHLFLWSSLLHNKIDWLKSKSWTVWGCGEGGTSSYKLKLLLLTLQVACSEDICGYQLLLPRVFSASVPRRWIKISNCLTFACHFTANHNACPSTQKINIMIPSHNNCFQTVLRVKVTASVTGLTEYWQLQHLLGVVFKNSQVVQPETFD